MRQFPTADDVARAVVAAAKACRLDPFEVVGARQTNVPVAASRARAYAAMALDRAFNAEKPKTPRGAYKVSRVAIARMVGAPAASQSGLINGIEARLARRQDMAWWLPSVFDSVLRAVVASLSMPATKAVVEPDEAPAWPGVRSITAPVTRGGVTVADGEIFRGDRKVALDLAETALAAALCRVWPGLLPVDRLAAAVWGRPRADADFQIKIIAELLSPELAPLGLKIVAVPKIGFCLSEI